MSEIEYLSRENIELKSEEVIEYFDIIVLEKPTFTPMIEFLSKTQEKTKLEVYLEDDLGFSMNNRKILGKFSIKPRVIFIDKILNNDIRFNFTVGHEYGHFVLHRKLDLSKINYNVFEDTEVDLVTGEKKFKTDRHWLEWQANFFSSAILMPRATFKWQLINIQEELDIHRNQGILYVNKDAESIRLYNQIVSKIASFYHVSKSSAEYRLKSLSLLIDHRLKDVKHISEFLSEE